MNVLRVLFFLFLLGISSFSFAQYSIATDASFLRNGNAHAKFSAFGQSVQSNFYINKKEALYAAVSYYTNGNFKNKAVAIAKDSAQPATLPYTIRSIWRYRQLSLGWKHYFKGTYDAEENWNLYGAAGFGIVFGKAENKFSQTVDTTKYIVQKPVAGTGNFRRLTLDGVIGAETPLGTNIFVYSELRGWLAASHYPSPYLLENSDHLPRAVSLNIGLRILIE